MSSPESDPSADGEPEHGAPPPRDPKRVRFWGWMAFAAAIVIVVVGLFVGRPWTHCHCPLHRHGHSLHAPVLVRLPEVPDRFAPARVAVLRY